MVLIKFKSLPREPQCVLKFLLGWVIIAVVCHIIFPRVLSYFEKFPSLLVVSFDGFRWDYLSRTATPNFRLVINGGVHARRGLTNVFATSTMTNHWTMVTGLYAESHGIIENEMFDPVINKTFIPLYRNQDAVNDWRFYDAGAEPIWVTNQLQNSDGRSGSIMWWGAEYAVKNIRPTFHMPYDLSVDDKTRIDTMLSWLTSPVPINLGLLYFSEPDHTAHKWGPDSHNVTNMIRHTDQLTGYLFAQLAAYNLLNNLNIIITSDHGFASVSRDRLIFLDHFVNPSWYKMVHYTPVAAIIPLKGMEDIIYTKLKQASGDHHFQVYRKAEIPERFHYKNNVRVTPIIAVADITYSFIVNMTADSFVLAGMHGYDNAYEDMHPFFMATGPSFKENFSVASFSSLDLYPLMCHLLGLKPAPNNGSTRIVSKLLRDYHEHTSRNFMFYILFFLVVTIIGGVCLSLACNHSVANFVT